METGSASPPANLTQHRLGLAVAAARAHLHATQAEAAARPSPSAARRVQEARQAFYAAAWGLALTETRLARLIAQQAQGLGDAGLEDLEEEGLEGLFIAACKFEPSRGYRFATMARWWVRAKVNRAAHRDRSIRPPVTLEDHARRLRKLPPGLTEAESAAWLGMSQRAWRLLRLWSQDACVRLDAPVNEDGESIGARLVSEEPEPEEVWSEALDRAGLHLAVDTALLALDARRLMVVRRVLGLEGDEPMTYADLGREVGLSRERVRQLWREAIAILQAEVEAHRKAQRRGP